MPLEDGSLSNWRKNTRGFVEIGHKIGPQWTTKTVKEVPCETRSIYLCARRQIKLIFELIKLFFLRLPIHKVYTYTDILFNDRMNLNIVKLINPKSINPINLTIFKLMQVRIAIKASRTVIK